MKILLAVDGSAYSDTAVEEVAKRPWPPESEVKVVSAAETPVMVNLDPFTSAPEYFAQIQKAVLDAAKALIDRALAQLKGAEDKTLKISGEVIQGSPGQVIVEEAEKWGADLIVMGSRGLSVWNRLVLGSVSNAVLHHAKCSVEIVRKSG